MPILPKKLALKIIVPLTVILILVDVIGGFYSVQGQQRQVLDAMILGADQLSKSITSATWNAMLTNHRDGVHQVMQTIAQKQGVSRIRIFNKEGRVMYTTVEGESLRVDKRSETCILCHDSNKPLVKVAVPSRAKIFTGPDGARQLIMVTPIYNESACSQAACHAHPEDVRVLGVLDIALDLTPLDRVLESVNTRVVWTTVAQILLTTILVILFIRRFVDRPIRKLIGETRSISAMQLDRPIAIDSSEELGELAHSFDIMRLKLKQSMEDLNLSAQNLETKVEERTIQLKAAHLKLLHTDRLASLGQLSASVAHEINNPLSGVLNLSMLMQRILKDDGIPANRIEEFRKYLSQVINETSRVGRIVSDLLAFSRRSKTQRTDADLNGIVRTTHSLLSHKLKLANVTVELHLQENLPRVRCDSSQIQQVVLNLLMNGAEATHAREEGGKVTITSRLTDGGKSIAFDVVDNGEGISPENLSKIFDPFFTTKGEGKGVGLGLAVVFGIVEAHGGEITVNSQVKQGTTFTVTLPIASPTPDKQQLSESAAAS